MIKFVINAQPLYPYRNHGIPQHVDNAFIRNQMLDCNQEVGLQVGSSHILFNTPADILYYVLFRDELYIDPDMQMSLDSYIERDPIMNDDSIHLGNFATAQVLPTHIRRRDGRALSSTDLFQPWQHIVELFYLDYEAVKIAANSTNTSDTQIPYYRFYTSVFNLIGVSMATNRIYYHPYVPFSDDDWSRAQDSLTDPDDNTSNCFTSRNPRYNEHFSAYLAEHPTIDIQSDAQLDAQPFVIDNVTKYALMKSIDPNSFLFHVLGFSDYQMGITRSDLRSDLQTDLQTDLRD